MENKKEQKKYRKVGAVFLVLLLAFYFSPILKNRIVQIAEAASTSGWLWGGSEDSNLPGEMGVMDRRNETGVGWISLNGENSPGGVAYNVNIPDASCVGEACALTGYAWSENLGWIDFEPQHHCIVDGSAVDQDPSAGACLAPADKYCAQSCSIPAGLGTGGAFRSVNNLQGWVRIVGIAKESADGNSGNWGGWIHLNGSGYGVTISPADGKLLGYGWNGEEPDSAPNIAKGLGWIDFKWAKIGDPPPLSTVEAVLTANPDSGLAPLTASMKVDVSGSATGNNIVYELDCNYSGVIFTPELTHPTSTGETSHIFTNACTYSANGVAAARVTREGVVSNIAETSITIFPPSFCSCDPDETSVCLGITYDDTCDPPGKCRGKKDCSGRWIEVQP